MAKTTTKRTRRNEPRTAFPLELQYSESANTMRGLNPRGEFNPGTIKPESRCLYNARAAAIVSVVDRQQLSLVTIWAIKYQLFISSSVSLL